MTGPDWARVVAVLRDAGATFALRFGSRISGSPRPTSDHDVAAMLPPTTDPWTLDVGDDVDLVSLSRLPLSVAGRVALEGVLLFDDDPPARVRWQAMTRTRYFDEAHHRADSTDDVLQALSDG